MNGQVGVDTAAIALNASDTVVSSAVAESASFNSLTAVPAGPYSPSHVAVYNELGLTAAPVVVETAGANLTRDGENERVMAHALLHLKNDVALNDRAVKRRLEEGQRQQRRNAATNAEIQELRTTSTSNRSSLAQAINAVNDLKKESCDCVDSVVRRSRTSAMHFLSATRIHLSAVVPDSRAQAQSVHILGYFWAGQL
ncbi:hypothetical protein B0H14DRAFT_3423801 [Mycena olivaceomarginata]|nr:hypothetical protein B0H14DRAFT_3423801 [Mycena olivaceomarginata]